MIEDFRIFNWGWNNRSEKALNCISVLSSKHDAGLQIDQINVCLMAGFHRQLCLLFNFI